MHIGSCHCGNVKYEVDADFTEGLECNCSHCSRKGYLLSFVSRDKVKMLTPMEQLSTYHFNRHVIDHHFCPNCGCAPIAFGTAPDGSATAAINIRCIEGIDLTTIRRQPVDGRSF